MSSVLIVGDAHGYKGVLEVARLTQKLAVDYAIILGDIWDVDYNIDGVTTVPIHIVMGNHEKFYLWYRGQFGRGLIGHLNYTKFFLDDRAFGVLGQIDDTSKIRDLMDLGLILGNPDEIFFERLEGQQVRDKLGFSDVLLFHDAPFPFVLGHRPLPKDPNWVSAGPMDRPEIVGSDYLNEVVRTVHPKFAFHGHLHLLDIRYIGQTRVYGLPPIDPSFQHRGYAILDTTTMRAEYHDL